MSGPAHLTDAQEMALAMLPVEVGSWGAPRRSTLRVLIRLGLAREVGSEVPTTVVPTERGRELRARWREAADS
jgi:hypothetical protein